MEVLHGFVGQAKIQVIGVESGGGGQKPQGKNEYSVGDKAQNNTRETTHGHGGVSCTQPRTIFFWMTD